MWKTMFRLEEMETKGVKNKKVKFAVFTSSSMNKIHTLKKITKASLRAEMGEIRRLREEMVSMISFA